MGSREQAVMGLESQAVSARVPKQFVTFLVKPVIIDNKLARVFQRLIVIFFPVRYSTVTCVPHIWGAMRQENLSSGFANNNSSD